MAPPPKKKQRAAPLLNVFLKEDDWLNLKAQLLKIVKKVESFAKRLDTLESQTTNKPATTTAAGTMSPELYTALQNLLVPVLGEPAERVDSRNYKTKFDYEGCQVFRNGQMVTSKVELDGEFAIHLSEENFPNGIGVTEEIVTNYTKKLNI